MFTTSPVGTGGVVGSADRAFYGRLSRGKLGESEIADWLRSTGYSVMPVYDVPIDAGKGPRVYGPSGEEWAAPDLLAYRGPKVIWFEAKVKTGFSFHRNTGRWVTGIDAKHFEDYCHIADTSPWPVWILFLQQGQQVTGSPPCPIKGLFGNELGVLRESINHRHDAGGRGGRGAMVYWAIESLLRIAAVDEDGRIVRGRH